MPSFQEIEELIGQEAAQKIVQKHGGLQFRVPYSKEKKKDLIRSLLKRGLSAQVVAERTGAHIEYVYRIRGEN